MTTRKTYVEFLHPGVFVDESSVTEVDVRNPNTVDVPAGAYGFRFFDIVEASGEGVQLRSDQLDMSPVHYYGGRIMTIEDVRAEMPDARALIFHMETNGYDRVIQCRTGNFKPFGEDDIYIEAACSFMSMGKYPEQGQKVKTLSLTTTQGMIIAEKHLAARRPHVEGVVKNIVPGHGGDVWFVEHKDGSVAAYSIDEMQPA